MNECERLLSAFDDLLRVSEEDLARARLAGARFATAAMGHPAIRKVLAGPPRVIGSVAMGTAVRQWPSPRLVVDMLCQVRLEALDAQQRTPACVADRLLTLGAALPTETPLTVCHRTAGPNLDAPLVLNLVPAAAGLPGGEPLAIVSRDATRWIACDPLELVRLVRSTNAETDDVRGAHGGGLVAAIRIMKHWRAAQGLDPEVASPTTITSLLTRHARAWRLDRAGKRAARGHAVTLGAYLYELLWRVLDSLGAPPDTGKVSLRGARWAGGSPKRPESTSPLEARLALCVSFLQRAVWAQSRAEAARAMRSAFGERFSESAAGFGIE